MPRGLWGSHPLSWGGGLQLCGRCSRDEEGVRSRSSEALDKLCKSAPLHNCPASALSPPPFTSQAGASTPHKHLLQSLPRVLPDVPGRPPCGEHCLQRWRPPAERWRAGGGLPVVQGGERTPLLPAQWPRLFSCHRLLSAQAAQRAPAQKSPAWGTQEALWPRRWGGALLWEGVRCRESERERLLLASPVGWAVQARRECWGGTQEEAALMGLCLKGGCWPAPPHGPFPPPQFQRNPKSLLGLYLSPPPAAALAP